MHIHPRNRAGLCTPIYVSSTDPAKICLHKYLSLLFGMRQRPEPITKSLRTCKVFYLPYNFQDLSGYINES